MSSKKRQIVINLSVIILAWSANSCDSHLQNTSYDKEGQMLDSITLSKMISIREKAMIQKDIYTAMNQFSEDATWINSQGYYFEGKDNVLKFHNILANNDSLDYYYEAGKPRIRIMDSNNALAYYSWKMFWYKKDNPRDTTFKEIGLMTLNARKLNKEWKWTAVTNQHTPWFYEEILPLQAE